MPNYKICKATNDERMYVVIFNDCVWAVTNNMSIK